MASKVDIWNMALSHIGHRANIADPDESSVEANHCRRFYPIALATLLERYDWRFASRRENLAEVANPSSAWGFAYSLPNQCLAPRTVLLPGGSDDDEQPFTVESDASGAAVLYSDAEDAVLRYTGEITDTNRLTPLFLVALSYELGALLVGPIPKDIKLKKAMLDAATYYAGLASASDANASKSDTVADFIPSSLAAR
jgi:hypothetical protein